MTAADVLIESVIDWGVDFFSDCRRRYQRTDESLRTRKDHFRFVQVRHEESAAFMACGYAKFRKSLAEDCW
jgi:thiamine pyrophosphate-dependent acetolactate synthase large subunit-like protein